MLAACEDVPTELDAAGYASKLFSNWESLYFQLLGQPLRRSIPKRSQLRAPATKRLFQHMLENGFYSEGRLSIPAGEDNWSVGEVKVAAQQALLAGWVSIVRRDEETLFEFPSRVHEWWVVHLPPDERKYCRDGLFNPRIYINMLVPDHTQGHPPYSSPREVAVDAIRLFVSSRIRPAGQAYMAGPSRGAIGDYFYRSLYRLLGGGAICSPEFGIEGEPGDGAWWDIWLPQHKFAIVVATAGSSLREIEARFKPGGRYYDWVESGRCSMWAIVYFLFNSPQFNDVPFEGLVPSSSPFYGID